MFARIATRAVFAARPVTRVNALQVRAMASYFMDPKEVADRVVQVLHTFEKIDKSKITETAHFINDLGLDSLDSVEVTLALEDEFNIEINDEDSDKIQSVPAAVEFLSTNPNVQ